MQKFEISIDHSDTDILLQLYEFFRIHDIYFDGQFDYNLILDNIDQLNKTYNGYLKENDNSSCIIITNLLQVYLGKFFKIIQVNKDYFSI